MRVVDSIIALRIVYLLTVPFNKTDAYKLGLIDENGNKIKNAETSDEKNATSMLHRLVWNIKKVFALVPGGKTRIGSLVAAYMLVRESHEMKLSEEDSLKYFNENFDKVWNLPFEEREWVEDAITTYRRWATYLNLEDSTHKQIYEFATKNRTGIIVLKDSKGTLKGIRYSRKGSGNWANIKRKPQQIVESSLYTEIEIENIEL